MLDVGPPREAAQWLNAVQPQNLCITEEMVQVGLQVGILISSETLQLTSTRVNTRLPAHPPHKKKKNFSLTDPGYSPSRIGSSFKAKTLHYQAAMALVQPLASSRLRSSS